MEFTPEQQAFIDNLIKEKYTAAYQKAGAEKDTAIAEAVAQVEAKYKTEMSTLQNQISEMETKIRDTSASNKPPVDDTAVNERIAAIEAELQKARESAIKGRLESIAAKLNAVDPEQAAILIKMHTQTDENGNLIVVNSAGQSRMNAENKPMSVEELAQEFLTNNTHLVKASGSAGAGTQGTTGIQTGTAKTISRADYEKLSPQAQSDFIKAGGVPVD